MEREEIIGRLECLLFVAGDSMELEELAACLGIDADQLAILVDEEAARREASRAGILLKRFEGRVQLATRQEYGELVSAVFGKKSAEELSRAMLETLAIVAYKQPVTRGEIDQLRGVNSSYVLGALEEKGLVVEAGRRDVVGRPILYATDEAFLRHFGIESLDMLPPLPEEDAPPEEPAE